MEPTTTTYTLLHAFVDELARCGLRDACTSPGSRGTPLLLSLAHEPRIRCHSHVDERCAGFFAVGLAKASAAPVAVTCTSGTALAELLPAVVEAHEARVPLLVLSADRPPELRGNGAGQTIDQLKLFGTFAKWFFEVGDHDASKERLRWMRTLACRAFWTAVEDRPGAVHLNFPLREPLVCDPPPPPAPGGRADGAPYVIRRAAGALHYERRAGWALVSSSSRAPREPPPGEELAKLLGAARRGVLVAGRDERRSPTAQAAASFCESAGWPLLADPMSGARQGAAAIAHYDALLRDPSFAAAKRPEAVVRIGDLPVSKPLRSWLAGLPSGVPQIALDPEGAWQDPDAVVSHSLALDGAAALSPALGESLAGPKDWLEGWRSADESAGQAIGAAIAAAGLSEPAVAAELGVLLPSEAILFVASSMPVRDIESFWPVRPDPPEVLCNRGANGIDGTVSSAFGAAAADERPVVLMIGDVALAHDIGGLLAAERLKLKLTIVLVNNEGGGIFDFLPVAEAPMALQSGVYDQHVLTPTGLDFSRAAALYGLSHEAVEDLPGLRRALERTLSQAQSGIVEVRSERKANVELHRRLWKAVAEAL